MSHTPEASEKESLFPSRRYVQEAPSHEFILEEIPDFGYKWQWGHQASGEVQLVR